MFDVFLCSLSRLFMLRDYSCLGDLEVYQQHRTLVSVNNLAVSVWSSCGQS